MPKTSEVNKLVEHLFRNEAGKLVAVLTKLFGVQHLELAEDVVQDTLISAMDSWLVNGIPDNPAAWITLVAKRKAINQLKRQNNTPLFSEENSYKEVDTVFLENEITDSQLRMVFTCCHPTLPLSSQIALTLKTLGGMSIGEIAQALLTNEATINKRLYRAKQKIRTEQISFEIPTGKQLDERLESVYVCLYLLFNEGYNSSSTKTVIRKGLCAEAIRLTKLLSNFFTKKGTPHALLALMYFHVARFDARIDDKGAIVIFEDQDRSLWDKEIISYGLLQLHQSKKEDVLSSYHIEATIAAEHCLSENFVKTNWKNIHQYYQLLYEFKNNPIILLNLAIVKSKLGKLKEAINEIEVLKEKEDLSNYFLLYATLGELYLQKGENKEAKKNFEISVSLTQSVAELNFLAEKIKECG